MAITISGGITFSGGAVVGTITAPQSNLVLDLDAGRYSALPDGVVLPGTGGYTVSSPGAIGGLMVWQANAGDAGGVFRKIAATGDAFMTFGPDWSSGTQPYTVMMIYRPDFSDAGSGGRLLNANSDSPDWLLGMWNNGNSVQNVFFPGEFVGGNEPVDANHWQWIWATCDGAGAAQSWVANTTTEPQLYGTVSSGAGGFNGLRLFGRYTSPITTSEEPLASVGVVKVWDGVLTLPQIRDQYYAYQFRYASGL